MNHMPTYRLEIHFTTISWKFQIHSCLGCCLRHIWPTSQRHMVWNTTMVSFSHYEHIIASSLIGIKLIVYSHTSITQSLHRNFLFKQTTSTTLQHTLCINNIKTIKECFQNTSFFFKISLTKIFSLSFLPFRRYNSNSSSHLMLSQQLNT